MQLLDKADEPISGPDLTPGPEIYQIKINQVNSQGFKLVCCCFSGYRPRGWRVDGEGRAQFAHVSARSRLHSPVVVSYQRPTRLQHQPQHQLCQHAHRGQRRQQRFCQQWCGQEQWKWCSADDGSSERQVWSDGQLDQVWRRWGQHWLHPVNIFNQG